MSIKSQNLGGSDVPRMENQREPNYMMGKKEYAMLNKGKEARTKEGLSENVSTEMHAGKPQKQAVAIAYSEARKHSKSESHSNQRHKEHR